MPIKCIITSGTTADCTQAATLIGGLEAAYLLADRGYDTNALIALAKGKGMEPIIPSKRNRTEQREHDRELYKARHQVEKAFLHLKQWRGIATRYAKNTSSFVAAVQIRCMYLWAAVL
jgi:transposase